jgi:hypothetical protein
LISTSIRPCSNILWLGDIGEEGRAIQLVDRGLDVARTDLEARCAESLRESPAQPLGGARDDRDLSLV